MELESKVTAAVLEALQEVTGTPIEELEATLASEEEWPFDSIVLAEVLVQVEGDLGLTVPMDTDTAKALRSVTGLIRRIAGLVGVPA